MAALAVITFFTKKGTKLGNIRHRIKQFTITVFSNETLGIDPWVGVLGTK
jgi:hypothetical protein